MTRAANLAHQHRAAAAQAMRGGRLDVARAQLVAALALAPEDADAWFNLGWVERVAHNGAAALAAYNEAIRHGIARPEEAYVNRAVVLNEQLGDADAALLDIECALAVAPDFATAWLNRGLIEEDRGHVEGARTAYNRLLALQPGNGRAIARLAGLDRVEGVPAAALARLEDGLTRVSDDESRAELLFSLGDTLDTLESFDPAFAAYTAANELASALQPTRYVAAAQQIFANRLLAMPPPILDLSSENATAPVFICGMFRSGSTLVEQLLARHPALIGLGEREQIPLIARSLNHYPDGVTSLATDDLVRLRHIYRAGSPTNARVIDKRCDNVWHIPLILRLFPDATIIHTRRQPLDNLLSVFFLHFGDGVTYSNNLAEAAHYLGQVDRIMTAMKARYPGRIVDCDYDSLVAAPRATLEPILSAIGLGWDDACLQPSTVRSVRTASAWQVRQPLYSRSSGRWRNYAPHIEKFRAVLSPHEQL